MLFILNNCNSHIYFIALRPKRSSLVSENRPGHFFYHSPAPVNVHQMCIRIYIFNFKKQTNKINKNTKKARETKEEKGYLRKTD